MHQISYTFLSADTLDSWAAQHTAVYIDVCIMYIYVHHNYSALSIACLHSQELAYQKLYVQVSILSSC